MYLKLFYLTFIISILYGCTSFPVSFKTKSIQNPIVLNNQIGKNITIPADAENYANVNGLIMYSKNENTNYTTGYTTIAEKEKANADVDFINNNINNENIFNFGAYTKFEIVGYDMLGTSNSCTIYYYSQSYKLKKGVK